MYSKAGILTVVLSALIGSGTLAAQNEDGGAALKTLITAATLVVPTKLDGKITSGNDKVKA